MNIFLNNTVKFTRILLGATFIGLSTVAFVKKGDSQFENEPEQKNPMEGKKVVFIEEEDSRENADGFRGHLEAVGDAEENHGFYETYGKRAIDMLIGIHIENPSKRLSLKKVLQRLAITLFMIA